MMILKGKAVHLCKIKRRKVTDEPFFDEESRNDERDIWDHLSSSIQNAMGFQVDRDAMEFLNRALLSKMSADDLIPLLRNVHPPAPMTWVEFPSFMREDPQKFIIKGVLISHEEDPSQFQFFDFIEDPEEGVYAPVCFGSFHEGDGDLSLSTFPSVRRDKIAALSAEGADPEKVEARFHERRQALGDDLFGSVGVVLAAIQLLNAKNSPFMEDRTGGLSRQAYRALKRKDPDAAERARDTIRIRLNEEGRRHLDADRASRPGAPRQAHWVRGHLMNAPTKGPVWRRAHVRGEGEPVMRTRVLTSSVPEPEGP